MNEGLKLPFELEELQARVGIMVEEWKLQFERPTPEGTRQNLRSEIEDCRRLLADLEMLL